MDDEYFRSRMVLLADVADELSAQEAMASVLRSVQRPQARGFARALAGDVRQVDLVTPAGLFIAPALALEVDSRLSSVPNRIARGLLFHHTGQKLSPEYRAVAFPLEQIEYSNEKRRTDLAAFLTPVVATAPPHEFGKVFTYWFSTVDEDPNASAWIMLFYGKALFVALTAPDRMVTELERSVHQQKV